MSSMNEYYSEYYKGVKSAIRYYMNVAIELRIDAYDFRDICNKEAKSVTDVENIWRKYRDAKLDYKEKLAKEMKEEMARGDALSETEDRERREKENERLRKELDEAKRKLKERAKRKATGA